VTRVLVTGATGFIGRGTLEPLLAAGLEVHGVSSRPAPADAPEDVRWHRLDLLAHGAEEAVACVGATHLLHLAWTTEPGRFWTSPQNLDWLASSLRLTRAFARGGGRRMVMSGTCAEYAWAPDTHCVERETPIEPATLYATAKNALRATASEFAAQEGISMAWGRIFFVFGPHEQRGRLASSVAERLLRGETAETSLGEQVRDFLYAPELAEAFSALTLSGVEGPVNMASGEPMPVRDLITALADAAGRPELVALGARPTAPNEPARLTANVARLRDEVGWRPRLTLGEAAERTVAWWRQQLV
jgi:nucleoside-diphosphate-sugar epimerase